MDTFTIRDYCEETDFEVFYEQKCRYDMKTMLYEVMGASPCTSEEVFRKFLSERSKFHKALKIVADEHDHPIGYTRRAYHSRATRHNVVELMLWERAELTKAVLREMLEDTFDHGFSSMAVCRFHGWDIHLLNACRNIGMEEVGCIPDDFCYDGKLYPEYTYIMTLEAWQTENDH